MADRPIIFSSADVRATLDGRKTMFRRVIAFPRRGAFVLVEMQDGSLWPYQSDDGESALCSDGDEHPMVCPFGAPGDTLWVRETWVHYQTVNHRRRADGGSLSEVSDGLAGYRADGYDTINDFRTHIRLVSDADFESIQVNGDRWRSPIHMPRWASRLTLRLTDVRVERLQEISEEDAIAEGMTCWVCSGPINGTSENDCACFHTKANAIPSFQVGWDSINGKRAPWSSNPWVWVVSFERVKEADRG